MARNRRSIRQNAQRLQHETQNRERKKILIIATAVASILVTATIALGIYYLQHRQPLLEVSYSVEEIHQFWYEHLDHLVMKQLVRANHQNPVVNDIIQDRYRLIDVRHNKPRYEFLMIENYVSYTKDIRMVANSNTNDGKVTISFIVPALMDDFYWMQADRNEAQRNVFESDVTISYIHELDHLAFDTVESPETSLEKRVESEANTWAHTAQSMERIKNATAFQLSPSLKAYYTAWLQSGKNADSKLWRDSIRQQYYDTVE